jgi:hypothetical protein
MDNRYNTLKNKKDFETFVSEIPKYLKELACINKIGNLIFGQQSRLQFSRTLVRLSQVCMPLTF